MAELFAKPVSQIVNTAACTLGARIPSDPRWPAPPVGEGRLQAMHQEELRDTSGHLWYSMNALRRTPVALESQHEDVSLLRMDGSIGWTAQRRPTDGRPL